MFSRNNAYQYQSEQVNLFERELPHKSFKIPIRQREPYILRYTRKKNQIDQLRMDILDRCKLQELEYLQMLKRQRQMIEQQVRIRKKQYQIDKMEGRIAENKRREVINDSLDHLQKEKEKQRVKIKTQRAQSSQSSQLSSVGGQRLRSFYQKTQQGPNIYSSNSKAVEAVLNKEDQLKKMKQEILNKYRFSGQTGNKPENSAQKQSDPQLQWWIAKVRDYKQKNKKQEEKKKDAQSIYSDTDSQISK